MIFFLGCGLRKLATLSFNPTFLQSGGKTKLPQLGLHRVGKVFQGTFIQGDVHLRPVSCPSIIHLFEMVEIPVEKKKYNVSTDVHFWRITKTMA